MAFNNNNKNKHSTKNGTDVLFDLMAIHCLTNIQSNDIFIMI